jgi:hypothetical protein
LASFSSGGIDGAMVEDARTRWETARVLRDDDARRARGGDGDIAGEARAARAVAVANIARAQLARWMTRRRETPAIRYFYPAAEYCVRESSLCPMGKQSRRRDRHRARAREQNEKKRKHVRARSSPNVVRVGAPTTHTFARRREFVRV